jgi:hypothetical protein
MKVKRPEASELAQDKHGVLIIAIMDPWQRCGAQGDGRCRHLRLRHGIVGALRGGSSRIDRLLVHRCGHRSGASPPPLLSGWAGNGIWSVDLRHSTVSRQRRRKSNRSALSAAWSRTLRLLAPIWNRQHRSLRGSPHVIPLYCGFPIAIGAPPHRTEASSNYFRIPRPSLVRSRRTWMTNKSPSEIRGKTLSDPV